MKKRVSRSEIELAKETTKAVVLLLIILFLIATTMLIISGTLAHIIPFPRKNKTNNYIVKEINLDINNVNIEKYFNYVKITGKNVFNDYDYSNKDKVIVKDLNEKSKYRLASNLYLKDIKNDNGLFYVEEKSVKDSFELLFGKDTYKRQESIPFYDQLDLLFDSRNYSSNKSIIEKDGFLKPYETIISAKKKGNYLDITSSVVYYDSFHSIICKDKNCETIINNLNKESEYNSDYFSLYLEHNKDSLVNYTYHFIMDEAGFYNYLGYDKMN